MDLFGHNVDPSLRQGRDNGDGTVTYQTQGGGITLPKGANMMDSMLLGGFMGSVPGVNPYEEQLPTGMLSLGGPATTPIDPNGGLSLGGPPPGTVNPYPQVGVGVGPGPEQGSNDGLVKGSSAVVDDPMTASATPLRDRRQEINEAIRQYDGTFDQDYWDLVNDPAITQQQKERIFRHYLGNKDVRVQQLLKFADETNAKHNTASQEAYAQNPDRRTEAQQDNTEYNALEAGNDIIAEAERLGLTPEDLRSEDGEFYQDLGVGNIFFGDNIASVGSPGKPDITDPNADPTNTTIGQYVLNEDLAQSDIGKTALGIVVSLAVPQLAPQLAATLSAATGLTISPAMATGIINAGIETAKGGDLQEIIEAGLKSYGIAGAGELAGEIFASLPQDIQLAVADGLGTVGDITQRGLNALNKIISQVPGLPEDVILKIAEDLSSGAFKPGHVGGDISGMDIFNAWEAFDENRNDPQIPPIVDPGGGLPTDEKEKEGGGGETGGGDKKPAGGVEDPIGEPTDDPFGDDEVLVGKEKDLPVEYDIPESVANNPEFQKAYENEDAWIFTGGVLENISTGERRDVPNPSRMVEGGFYNGDGDPIGEDEAETGVPPVLPPIPDTDGTTTTPDGTPDGKTTGPEGPDPDEEGKGPGDDPTLPPGLPPGPGEGPDDGEKTTDETPTVDGVFGTRSTFKPNLLDLFDYFHMGELIEAGGMMSELRTAPRMPVTQGMFNDLSRTR